MANLKMRLPRLDFCGWSVSNAAGSMAVLFWNWSSNFCSIPTNALSAPP
jgi:hypothetical protein